MHIVHAQDFVWLSVLSAVAREPPPPVVNAFLTLSVCIFYSISTLYKPRILTIVSRNYTSCGLLTSLLSLLIVTLVPLTCPLYHRLWSAVTLCITVPDPARIVSLRLRTQAAGLQWPFCLMLYSTWGHRTLQALSQSKNPNIYLLTNADTKDISLSSVFSLAVLLFLPPCSMCIKRQTQHWL